MQLLLIEDCRNPADWLAEHMSRSGFVVSRIGFSREALAESPAKIAEAIVFDLGKSDVDGRIASATCAKWASISRC